MKNKLTFGIELRNKSLYARFTKNRKSTLYNLGIKINPIDWDKKIKRVKDYHPNTKKINSFIYAEETRLSAFTIDYKKQLVNLSLQEIKNLYSTYTSSGVPIYIKKKSKGDVLLKKLIYKANKRSKKKSIGNNISLDYIKKLISDNNYKCALTGVKLSFTFSNEESIDFIKSIKYSS